MVYNDLLKRKIPKSWDVCSFGDLCDTNKSSITKQFRTDHIKYIDTSSLTENILSDAQTIPFVDAPSRAQRIVTNLTILYSTVRPKLKHYGILLNPSSDTIVSTGFATFDAIEEKYAYYLYLTLTRADITEYLGNIAETAVSAYPSINPSDIETIKVAVPSKELLLQFHSVVNSLYSTKHNNTQEIDRLQRLRDELLPMLLNGQVNCDLYYIEGEVSPLIIYIAMKDKFIEMVVGGMTDCLTGAQLERLRSVLKITLQGVDLSCVCDKERVSHDNEVLLSSFLSAKNIEGCSSKTIDYYQMTIQKFLNKIEKDLRMICTDDIRSYLTAYQQENGSSMVTIDNMRRIFSSFFSWLEDEDYIVKSPVRRIHKVRTEKLVKETISDEQLETLRDSCEEIRDLAMIDFLASTGVRVGELVKINRADIDFQERQCVVLGKGNKERTVYFNARAKVHLLRYLAERDDGNAALFVGLNGEHRRLSIGGVEARLRWLGQRASVCRIHPHKFRRTMATVAIDKGMPIEQVQRLLGHKKIDTTLHYAMVNQNNVKNAHRKYIG